jgi:hypothetical protein
MNGQFKIAYVLLVVAIAAVFIASALLVTTEAEAKKKERLAELGVSRAPITTSGENVYITWWSNKTGNEEVMFRASIDNGASFGDKINLSNTTEADSDDAEIAASGNNVYVTWWERNETSDQPVLRISNDNGKTFGPLMMLATNGTIGRGE